MGEQGSGCSFQRVNGRRLRFHRFQRLSAALKLLPLLHLGFFAPMAVRLVRVEIRIAHERSFLFSVNG